MSFFTKKKPEPAPCPSDILAMMVAARMVAEPKRFTIKKESRPLVGYARRSGTWIDSEHGIKLVLRTGDNDSWTSPMYAGLEEFSRNGVPLAITSLGRLALMKAGAECQRLNDAFEQSRKQYEGDLAACDAIADMLKVPATPVEAPQNTSSKTAATTAYRRVEYAT